MSGRTTLAGSSEPDRAMNLGDGEELDVGEPRALGDSFHYLVVLVGLILLYSHDLQSGAPYVSIKSGALAALIVAAIGLLLARPYVVRKWPGLDGGDLAYLVWIVAVVIGLIINRISASEVARVPSAAAWLICAVAVIYSSYEIACGRSSSWFDGGRGCSVLLRPPLSIAISLVVVAVGLRIS